MFTSDKSSSPSGIKKKKKAEKRERCEKSKAVVSGTENKNS